MRQEVGDGEVMPETEQSAMRAIRAVLTLLSLATARDTDVLKSSGLFWARVVMRLVAAVTTP